MPAKKDRKTRPRRLPNIAQLAGRLGVEDANRLLTERSQTIVYPWLALCRKIQFSPDTIPRDGQVLTMLREVQNLIHKEKDPIARRLACYTFTKLVEVLEERVKEERSLGRISSGQGQGDASVVRNICLESLAGVSNQKTAKLQLAKHIAQGRRWSILCTDHPLLLVILPPGANQIITDSSITVECLKMVAAKIKQPYRGLEAASDVIKEISSGRKPLEELANMEWATIQ
ncbi:hypothetical protein NPX13_g2259 [Xylaria arbuscula]|uniref:Uncharacterized protein n=1 Tax=Xylaria arbuscula TaxID=114810 RepID=A0A9W8NKR4_9PEZI|nr:hypothetical protein NPX13_g2259 [Xylaria arbuscula]